MDYLEVFRQVIIFIVEWAFYSLIGIIVIKVGVQLGLEGFFDGHAFERENQDEK